MINRNALLCNLFVLTVACYVWGNGKGQYYAVGTSAPKGTWFNVLVNGEYRTGFSGLNKRHYVGKTTAGDVISVQVDGSEVCMGG
jgi:hypothetical protein